jgi:diphthamide synthase (EF-2-diphthine--ammonia ligase)
VKPKALLFWSSGKDSAWSLHVLRHRNEVEVVGLVTTFHEAANRVTMHAVRRELVEAQARDRTPAVAGGRALAVRQRGVRVPHGTAHHRSPGA